MTAMRRWMVMKVTNLYMFNLCSPAFLRIVIPSTNSGLYAKDTLGDA